MATQWLRRRAALVAFAFTLLVSVPAAAQTGGAVDVVVRDSQGGVLPGVTLTLRNAETGMVRPGVSAGEGSFRFGAVPPGIYSVKAELDGFATVDVTGLTVTIGLELHQAITLDVQSLQETVTVVANANVVDTRKTEVAGVVTQQQIETLPVSNRQTLMLSLLMPGTSQDGVRPYAANATLGAGLNYYSGGFMVDGVSNMELVQNEPRQDFPQASVREFKVNTTQYRAEFGGATGGLVSVVTKSGTNRSTGEFFEYFRDKALNAMNRFEQQQHDKLGIAKPDFRRNQVGATLGGPVVKDRIHYFGTVEHTKADQFVTVNTGQPRFYSSLEGSVAAPSIKNLYFVRGDAEPTTGQSVFVRYSKEDQRDYCLNCGGTSAAAGGNDQSMPRWSLVAGHTWVLSPRVLNEARFQVATFNVLFTPQGQPFWTASGEFPSERLNKINQQFTFPSLRWGQPGWVPSYDLHQTWIDFRDDFSLTTEWAGEHTWKFGFDFHRITGGDESTQNPGVWTFASDQLFDPTNPATIANLKNPVQFTARMPSVARPFHIRRMAGFIQDDWKPAANLTLNFGLRYEIDRGSLDEDLDVSIFPRAIPFIDPASRGDRNNWGPRLGLALDLDGGNSVVRAGYGRYYNNIRVLATVPPEKTNLLQTSIIISNPSYPDPYNGQDPMKFASTAPANITILANNMKNPEANVFNIGFTRALTGALALHVDGAYSRTRGDYLTVDINRPDLATGRRPLTAWGQVNQLQPISDAKYRAMYVRLEKRFERRYQYLVSYTLAKGQDNNPAGRVTDTLNPALDWGSASTDRRHVVVASASVLLPWHFTLGGVLSLRSAMPFSPLSGRDLNRDGFLTDYVPGTSRNQGSRNLDLAAVNAYRASQGLAAVPADQIDTNRFRSIDVRVGRTFQLPGRARAELVAQLFNIAGFDNLSAPLGGGAGYVTSALSPSFGRILTAMPRQQAELAIRLMW